MPRGARALVHLTLKELRVVRCSVPWRRLRDLLGLGDRRDCTEGRFASSGTLTSFYVLRFDRESGVEIARLVTKALKLRSRSTDCVISSARTQANITITHLDTWIAQPHVYQPFLMPYSHMCLLAYIYLVDKDVNASGSRILNAVLRGDMDAASDVGDPANHKDRLARFYLFFIWLGERGKCVMHGRTILGRTMVNLFLQSSRDNPEPYWA